MFLLKWVGKIVLLVVLLVIALFAYAASQNKPITSIQKSSPPSTSPTNSAAVTVVAQNLDTPWGIAFLPDNSMLVTERQGRVRLIDSTGKLNDRSITIAGVQEVGEGGLLGIAVDPDFSKNRFVYLYYTYRNNGSLLNKVVRFEYSVVSLGVACRDGDANCNSAATPRLAESKIIVDNIPSSSNHNGGRIKFGPDNALYISTGDAENPPGAQDKNSLGGKILRLATNGKVEVYSYGHRNVQGLAWDKSEGLWATEHGRSGVQSGLDEINKIEKGHNYGWPTIQGDETKNGMDTPKINSGSATWAPAGATIINNTLYFGGLRGHALYSLNLQTLQLQEHFKGVYGRIRDVVVGPDNMLYITTSNKDGRGSPKANDDKIIKINPQKL